MAGLSPDNDGNRNEDGPSNNHKPSPKRPRVSTPNSNTQRRPIGTAADVAPRPTAFARFLSAVAPRPAPVAPRHAAVAPRPAAVAPRPAAVAPRPAPVAPRPAAVAPRPAATANPAWVPRPIESEVQSPEETDSTTSSGNPEETDSTTSSGNPEETDSTTSSCSSSGSDSESDHDLTREGNGACGDSEGRFRRGPSKNHKPSPKGPRVSTPNSNPQRRPIGTAAAVEPLPDAVAPRPDAGAPRPDAGASRPDAGAPRPDAAAPRPSALAPRPSAAAPRPDAAAPRPDAAAPRPDAGAPRPSAAAPRPSVLAPRLDAVAPRSAATANPAWVPRPIESEVQSPEVTDSMTSSCSLSGSDSESDHDMTRDGNGLCGDSEGSIWRGPFSATLTDLDVLDCPICCAPLCSPVYQCENGHIACGSCCTKMTNKCSNCRCPIGIIRCRALEKVLESLTVPCQNISYGCMETLNYNKKLDHEKTCNHAPCSCPYISCKYVGMSKCLYTHFAQVHLQSSKQFVFDSAVSISLDFYQMQVFLQERSHNTLFILNRTTKSRGSLVKVVCVAPVSANGSFLYELTAKIDEDTSMNIKTSVECVTKWTAQACSRKCLFLHRDLIHIRGQLKLELTIRRDPAFAG